MEIQSPGSYKTRRYSNERLGLKTVPKRAAMLMRHSGNGKVNSGGALKNSGGVIDREKRRSDRGK